MVKVYRNIAPGCLAKVEVCEGACEPIYHTGYAEERCCKAESMVMPKEYFCKNGKSSLVTLDPCVV